jgi:hypothetical protein
MEGAASFFFAAMLLEGVKTAPARSAEREAALARSAEREAA